MASTVYPKFYDHLFNGDVDLAAPQNVRAVLFDTADDSYNAVDEFYSSIAAAARVAAGNLTTPTESQGVFSCSPTTFAAVSGDQFEALILVFPYTGVDSASPLFAYLDGGTNLPFTPDGNNIILTPNASGLVRFVP